MKILSKNFGTLLLSFWTFGHVYSSSLPERAEKKPNIIFIYADDLGWTDLGIYGSSYYETPHIDQLAREGLRFTQAYSVGPNCAPSRASLMTGLYTPRHGIYTVGTAARGDSTLRKIVPVENNTVLENGFTTIAEELKNVGYRTSLVGKWQLGNADQGADALSQGFDHVVGGSPGTTSYFFPYHTTKTSAHQQLDTGSEGEYLTDRLTDEAVKFVQSSEDQPFFLFLSYFAVHTPIQAKPDIIEKYEKKEGNEYHNNPTYAAMIQSLDQGVGKILQTLESLNLTENTLVIFYSDNGGMGAMTSQHPLRGSKGMLYEGGIRVPLIVKWKGKTVSGVSENPILGIDFYPTLLQLAQIQKPINPEVDGNSFVPVLLGKNPIQRDLFWHFPAYLEAFKGDLRHSEPFRTTPVSVIRSGNYKLLEFYEDDHLELYDLSQDVGEQNNLAETHPALTKEINQKLQVWREKVNAWEPSEFNPHYTSKQEK